MILYMPVTYFFFFVVYNILTLKNINGNTVGKQTPCKLLFVYKSQVKLTVRTELKFGKYLMPFMLFRIIIPIPSYAAYIHDC